MTTLRDIALTCPVCSEQFTSTALQTVWAAIGKTTDFRARSLGPPTIGYEIHGCPHCGFTGSESEFGCESVVDPTVQHHVWTELAPRLATAAHRASEKYEFAAKVAQWEGCDEMRVATLWLRAAWCCVEERDVEAERYYRRLAAAAFERALVAGDDLDRDDRAVVTYLVGELWRRIGDERRARSWFERVAGEVSRPREQRWIVDAAHQQKDNPREWF